MLSGKNNTEEKEFKINTGTKSILDLGSIVKYDNKTHLSTWYDDEEAGEKTCNRIHGTDGSLFPPHVKEDQVFHIFNKDICRSLPIEYKETVQHFGMDTLRFVPHRYTFSIISSRFFGSDRSSGSHNGCPSGTSLSTAVNLHLSGSNLQAIGQQSVSSQKALIKHSESTQSIKIRVNTVGTYKYCVLYICVLFCLNYLAFFRKCSFSGPPSRHRTAPASVPPGMLAALLRECSMSARARAELLCCSLGHISSMETRVCSRSVLSRKVKLNQQCNTETIKSRL